MRSIWKFLLAGVPLAIVAWVAVAMPAYALPTTPPKTAGTVYYHQFQQYLSGLCLNALGTADYVGVDQETCNSASTAQQWTLVSDSAPTWNWQLRNRMSGKCLTVLNGSVANAVPMVQYTCGTSYWSAQNWAWTSEPYTPPAQPRGSALISDASNKCVGDPWGLTGPTFLDQWTCVYSPNELWNEIGTYS